MAIRIVINEREVTNPWVRLLIALSTLLVAGIFGAFVIFVVLPLIGIAVTLTLGLLGVFLLALVIAIPLLIGGALLGALLSILSSPFIR